MPFSGARDSIRGLLLNGVDPLLGRAETPPVSLLPRKVAQIEAGILSEGIAYGPDGRFLYVANLGGQEPGTRLD
jgi:hypothetical protein